MITLLFLFIVLFFVGQFMECVSGLSQKKYWIFLAAFLLFALVMALFNEPKPRPEGWTVKDEERRKAALAKKEREDEEFLQLMRAAESLKKQGR